VGYGFLEGRGSCAAPWQGWLGVVILYPIFSVYPQELLYRAFFFHRYKLLFGDRTGMIAASAMVFGFVHIIFLNWAAIGLTSIDGVLFGWTYRKSGSLVLTWLERAVRRFHIHHRNWAIPLQSRDEPNASLLKKCKD
jgi:membrane protease YdiL (CAAX protease family)